MCDGEGSIRRWRDGDHWIAIVGRDDEPEFILWLAHKRTTLLD